jgi:hypothetical protein
MTIDSPNNANKLCFFKYLDENWNSYTIITCNCKLEDDFRDILNKGNYLITRNKGNDEWECLLEWNNDLPTLYTYANRFEEIGMASIQHIRVDTLPRMYYNKNLSSRYSRISQSCINRSDYCWQN